MSILRADKTFNVLLIKAFVLSYMTTVVSEILSTHYDFLLDEMNRINMRCTRTISEEKKRRKKRGELMRLATTCGMQAINWG